MAKNNINLMPEDLRSKEEDVKSKVKAKNLQPDLSVPNVQVELTNQELSGSKTKKSFWSKFRKPKKDKQPKAAEEVGDFKPLPELPVEDKTATEKAAAAPTDMFAETSPVEKAQPQSPAPVAPKQETPVNGNHGFSLNEPPVPEASVPKEDKKFHQPSKRIRAKFVESGMGVDLVPTSAKVKNWKQISTFVVITFIASVGLIVVFYFGLLTVDTSFNTNKSNTLAEIENIKSQLLDFKDINTEINATGKEITTVFDLLNQHIYWTNFFALLEKYTLDDVYYSSFASSNNGDLVLAATASSYYSVAKQLKVLQQEEASEFITEVNISSASASDAGVSFSISLTLNTDLFYYQEVN